MTVTKSIAGNQAKGRNTASAMLLTAAVTVLALPSGVLALSVGIGPKLSVPSGDADIGFEPARVDPRLARRFTAAHPGVPVTEVYALAEDVHDLEGLREVGTLLASSSSTP